MTIKRGKLKKKKKTILVLSDYEFYKFGDNNIHQNACGCKKSNKNAHLKLGKLSKRPSLDPATRTALSHLSTQHYWEKSMWKLMQSIKIRARPV